MAKKAATKSKAKTRPKAAPKKAPAGRRPGGRQWASRIVGHDRVAPDQLLANPLNWRKHPPEQRAALKAVIDEVGFIRSVTVNKRTGNLIDGHERVWQALTTDQPLIDIEYVDLSEEEEKKALATMDPIGEMSKVDHEKFEELLAEVEPMAEGLSEIIAGLRSKTAAEKITHMSQDGIDPAHPTDGLDDGAIRWSVPLSVDQERTVRDAIRLAKEKFSMDNTGDALCAALEEWAGTVTNG